MADQPFSSSIKKLLNLSLIINKFFSLLNKSIFMKPKIDSCAITSGNPNF